MNVLRHDNISIHANVEPEPHILQAPDKQIEHAGV
jgi:hypothetical protein